MRAIKDVFDSRFHRKMLGWSRIVFFFPRRSNSETEMRKWSKSRGEFLGRRLRSIIFLLFYWAFNQTLSRVNFNEQQQRKTENHLRKNAEESRTGEKNRGSQSGWFEYFFHSSSSLLTWFSTETLQGLLRYLFLMILFNSFVSLLLQIMTWYGVYVAGIINVLSGYDTVSGNFGNFAFDEYSSWIDVDGRRDLLQVGEDPSRSHNAWHLCTFQRSQDVAMILNSAGPTVLKGVGCGRLVTERVRSHAAM